jgi:hypothetical protein
MCSAWQKKPNFAEQKIAQQTASRTKYPYAYKQLTKKNITQEKKTIKTSINLNNGRIMKKNQVVQPLATIN